MAAIRRALLSVHNKEGIVPFARALSSRGVELISTGGTYAVLHREGIPVREVSSLTGFPEILEGRVKTLHPMIHGGILAKRDHPGHQEQLAQHGIGPIDLVVVNLYPFSETVAKPGVTLDEAIENIDIGGPTMLRSAAKNYKDVIAIVDPADYPVILDAIASGEVTLSEKQRLAQKVFRHTSEYDAAVFAYFQRISGSPQDPFPDRMAMTSYIKVQTLRYGENPHQSAAFYKEANLEGGWGQAKILWGKEMSYNNFLDADAAFALANEFEAPAAVVVKHNNPCGVATGKTLAEALKMAKETDPVSAFGGVVAFNRPLAKEAAEEVISTFMEVVVAPDIDSDALAILKTKKNLRVLAVPPSARSLDIRSITGGLLVQAPNKIILDPSDTLTVVTRRAPTPEEREALIFAWTVCKHVKSNAIVFARPGSTVGIGAGQMSRVDSVQIALTKARSVVAGAVMASDAFFPFRDGIDIAGKAGITAVIQPGGSIRDAEVIAAADEHQIAMVLTGIRHFRH